MTVIPRRGPREPRFTAICKLLGNSGDLTPMGARQILAVARAEDGNDTLEARATLLDELAAELAAGAALTAPDLVARAALLRRARQ